MLLRGMSQPGFLEKARNEIALRTVVGKRMDLYRNWILNNRDPFANVMRETMARFDQNWEPDATTSRQMRKAEHAAIKGGCKALKSAEYRRTYFPAPTDEPSPLNFDTDSLCAGLID